MAGLSVVLLSSQSPAIDDTYIVIVKNDIAGTVYSKRNNGKYNKYYLNEDNKTYSLDDKEYKIGGKKKTRCNRKKRTRKTKTNRKFF